MAASIPLPQTKIDYSKIRALVCEPSGIIRQGIRLALNNMGVREVKEASTFLAVHKACEEGDHHFLILNQEIEQNDATFIQRDLRLGILGRDPFILTVMVFASPEEPKVRAALNSGPDDLLLIPFAPDQIMSRLKVLVERRKPFVVTHDYIGPDRRAAPRPGATSATQFHVPNPARAQALSVSQGQYDRQRNDAVKVIAVERIKCLSGTIDWECKALTANIRDNSSSVETSFRSLVKLENVTGELSKRVGTVLGHATDGIDAFRARCAEFKSHPSALTFSEVNILAQAGHRITSTYAAR
jgi:two-component system, OmpR family, phosphate regulon response regulator PhoB